MTQTLDQFIESRANRRMTRDATLAAKMERREIAAEQMIGELCREGKTVWYVWPQGGKYREGSRLDLIAFLIRNNYA